MILVPGLVVHAHVWAARSIVSTIIASSVFRQIVDYSCKFLLKDLDALLDNSIWFQIADTLNLEVKSLWDSIEVEWFTLLRRLLPTCILALWPANISA